MRAIAVGEKDMQTCIDAGPAPMLQWLKIADLVVDDSYQRELKRESWTVIRKIASNFKWSRFSPVFVAPIEGGRYAIIDGQHRTHAAAMCGFDTVPCQVVQMSKAEQAQAFAAVNGMATKVTVWNLYRASLAAGEAWATAMQAVAAEAGCKVAVYNATAKAKEAGTIYAIDGLRRIIDKFSPAEVTRALRVLRDCKGWGDEAHYWQADIVLPVLNTLCRRPALLERPDFSETFAQWPLWNVIDAIAENMKASTRSGVRPRPKTEQLQDRLFNWLTSQFPPATGALVAKPAPAPTITAPMLSPTANDLQRELNRKAAERRKRLGM